MATVFYYKFCAKAHVIGYQHHRGRTLLVEGADHTQVLRGLSWLAANHQQPITAH